MVRINPKIISLKQIIVISSRSQVTQSHAANAIASNLITWHTRGVRHCCSRCRRRILDRTAPTPKTVYMRTNRMGNEPFGDKDKLIKFYAIFIFLVLSCGRNLLVKLPASCHTFKRLICNIMRDWAYRVSLSCHACQWYSYSAHFRRWYDRLIIIRSFFASAFHRKCVNTRRNFYRTPHSGLAAILDT